MSRKSLLLPKNKYYHCIACDKKLDDYGDCVLRTLDVPISKGIKVKASWNFGSQLWDDKYVAHIAICDECLVRRGHRMFMEHTDETTGKRKIRTVKSYLMDWFTEIKKHYSSGDSYFDSVSTYFK